MSNKDKDNCDTPQQKFCGLRFDGIDQSITEWKAESTAWREKSNEKMDKIISALYGNGQPGLTTRMALLQSRVDDHLTDAREVKKAFRDSTIGWFVDKGLTLVLAAIAFYLVTHLLK
jgi:hypothetical protein